MKKLFALFTVVLYLALSSGLAIEIHRCMGRVADISFSHSGEHKCGKCGMGSNECCKDELKFVKVQNSHKLIDFNYDQFAPFLITRHNIPVVLPRFAAPLSARQGNTLSPPGSSGSLCILNCVFRI